MKKILTILVLLCSLSPLVYSQGISVGAKFGLNLADQTYSGGGGYSSPGILPGFHVGGYVTAMITEHLGIQPELLYSGQGAKSGGNSLKLAYVTIPLLARFNVNSLLSFHAGPQFGILTSAKVKNGSNSVDVKDGYKSSDVGIAAGVTVDLPIKLNFTFRIVKGLSNIADDQGDDFKAKNFNIQLSVGYKIFGK